MKSMDAATVTRDAAPSASVPDPLELPPLLPVVDPLVVTGEDGPVGVETPCAPDKQELAAALAASTLVGAALLTVALPSKLQLAAFRPFAS